MSRHNLTKIVLLAVLANVLASAAWERRVNTESGEWKDVPSPHSLEFFLKISCPASAPDERAKDCYQQSPPTNLKLLGTFGKIKAYDLLYLEREDDDPYIPAQINAKAILVEAAPGLFREIYFQSQEQEDARVSPTDFIRFGKEQFLRTRYDIGGIYGIFEESFITIAPSGNSFMELAPIYKAAGKVLPKGISAYLPVSKFDFASGTWESGTEDDNANIGPKVACCIGVVTVRFRIENGRFVPIDAKYRPN
jgi:hypothetical protein